VRRGRDRLNFSQLGETPFLSAVKCSMLEILGEEGEEKGERRARGRGGGRKNRPNFCQLGETPFLSAVKCGMLEILDLFFAFEVNIWAIDDVPSSPSPSPSLQPP
jgi:hypothetical protein